jgi:hypothetical protein
VQVLFVQIFREYQLRKHIQPGGRLWEYNLTVTLNLRVAANRLL